MDDVRVRPADVTDADAVFGLLSEFATSYRPVRSIFDQNYELLLSAMLYDSTDLVVAEVDGAVVGYALAARSLVLYANGKITELQELMVDPRYRGRGIGGRLVSAVIERARVAGAVEVTVPTRRAKDFYLRLGFEETAAFLKRGIT